MASRQPHGRTRPNKPGRGATAGERGADAVRQEVETLLDTIDERYRQGQEDSATDSRKRREGLLGGPGNFGGGALDAGEPEDETPRPRR